MSKRDHIAEISEKKLRSGHASSRYKAAINHLHDMSVAIDALARVDFDLHSRGEVYRGFPVGITATLESYFRATIAALVDYGEPFRGRVRERNKDVKLDVATLLSMEASRVSLGDLVAHDFSLNGPDDLGGAYKFLSGTDLWPLVGPAHEPATGTQFILPTSPEEIQRYLYVSLKELYRVRHIVCHELRGNVEVNEGSARGFCDAAIEFLLIADYLFDQLMPPAAG